MKQSQDRPRRTCIGCRCRADKAELIRVVFRDGELFLDQSQDAPGRGAYVHPKRGCVETADQRKAVARALRVEGPLALGRLFEQL